MANKSTPAPASASKPAAAAATKPAPTAPGGYVVAPGFIELNPGRPRTTVTVRNTGDRPVQIGSHFHFFEVNRYLEFDRAAAFGMRLDIPAGTAVRFEPGQSRTVTLVALAGDRTIYGFRQQVMGRL